MSWFPYQNLGRMFRTYRLARNRTQQQVALCIGRDASYVSHIEKGERVPSLLLTGAIIDVLEIPPYVVFEAIEADDRELKHKMNKLSLDTSIS